MVLCKNPEPFLSLSCGFYWSLTSSREDVVGGGSQASIPVSI